MRISARTSLAPLAAALGAVLLLGCGAGVSSSPATGDGTAAAVPAVTTVKVGQAIGFTANNFNDGTFKASVTVTSVNQAAKSDNDFDKAERGQFVAAEVVVQATEGDNDIGPSNFRLVGKDGTVYQAEILIVGITPALDAATEIKQGQKKAGKVVFDCDPKNIAGGRVELNSDGGETVGYWTY